LQRLGQAPPRVSRVTRGLCKKNSPGQACTRPRLPSVPPPGPIIRLHRGLSPAGSQWLSNGRRHLDSEHDKGVSSPKSQLRDRVPP
jgi:hypothetical protein